MKPFSFIAVKLSWVECTSEKNFKGMGQMEGCSRRIWTSFRETIFNGGDISLTNVLNNIFDISTSSLIQINLRLIDYCLWR